MVYEIPSFPVSQNGNKILTTCFNENLVGGYMYADAHLI